LWEFWSQLPLYSVDLCLILQCKLSGGVAICDAIHFIVVDLSVKFGMYYPISSKRTCVGAENDKYLVLFVIF